VSAAILDAGVGELVGQVSTQSAQPRQRRGGYALR
jgi:hypothetical protein